VIAFLRILKTASVWLLCVFVVSCTNKSNENETPPSINLEAEHNPKPLVKTPRLPIVELNITETLNQNYTLEATLPNGHKIENIRFYKREASWVLNVDTKWASRMPVLNASSERDYYHLSEQEFLELLDQLFIFAAAHNLAPVDKIVMELRLINPVWIDTVSAIREVATTKSGRVKIKELEMVQPVQQVISTSPSIVQFCKLSSKYGYTCKVPPTYVSMVFQHEYRGTKWSVIANLDDVGLNRHSIFSIRLQE
jgi:hypothetical protein